MATIPISEFDKVLSTPAGWTWKLDDEDDYMGAFLDPGSPPDFIPTGRWVWIPSLIDSIQDTFENSASIYNKLTKSR